MLGTWLGMLGDASVPSACSACSTQHVLTEHDGVCLAYVRFTPLAKPELSVGRKQAKMVVWIDAPLVRPDGLMTFIHHICKCIRATDDH